MMSTSHAAHAAHSRVVRALYRGMIRAAKTLDARPEAAAEIPLVLGSVPMPAGHFPSASPDTPASAVDTVRHNFRAHAGWAPSSPDTKELVDLGFDALRAVNLRVAALGGGSSSGGSSGPLSRPSTVMHSVGQIVRHKTHKYRGVIVGWTPTCTAGDAWVARNASSFKSGGASQPFYHVLVDVRDRPSQVTYVAQENIEVLRDGGKAGPVIHPLVTRYFSEYRPGGHFVPNAELLEAFPYDAPSGHALHHRVVASAAAAAASVSSPAVGDAGAACDGSDSESGKEDGGSQRGAIAGRG
jgi:hemimethylated DNA binding protein